MAIDPQTQVLAFLDAFHDRPDFEALGGYFAENGYYQPLVPALRPYRGRAAIVEILRTQYRTYHDCRCEIHTLAANGPFVFTERSDHVILYDGDRRVSSRVCAVFELDEEGLITAWREYWDTGDIARQMGLEVAAVLTATVGDEAAA